MIKQGLTGPILNEMTGEKIGAKLNPSLDQLRDALEQLERFYSDPRFDEDYKIQEHHCFEERFFVELAQVTWKLSDLVDKSPFGLNPPKSTTLPLCGDPNCRGNHD